MPTFKSITNNNPLFNEAMRLYNQNFQEDIREDIPVFERSFQLKDKDSSKYHFLTVLVNNQFAGFITFHLETSHHIGYIVYLVVDPKFRGQSLARKLMNEAERVMNETDPNLKYIMLECEKDENGKSPLEPFYKKFGFYPVDINYLQPPLHGGDPVPLNLFVKSEDKMNDDMLEAIKHIYREKFGQTNLIPDEDLQNYMNQF